MIGDSNTFTDFVGFPKISRYRRETLVTEKVDGTNSVLLIGPDGEFLTGSRNRWITPEQDNFGFSAWAHAHKEELMQLGPGRHFGEWWGSGIQRGYGLPKGERRWSLFNVLRWCLHGETPQQIPTGDPTQVKMQQPLPACVGLVPVLWRGMFQHMNAAYIMDQLVAHGSFAAPGFMQPEGIVIHHVPGNVSFKITICNDDEPKSRRSA